MQTDDLAAHGDCNCRDCLSAFYDSLEKQPQCDCDLKAMLICRTGKKRELEKGVRCKMK